MKRLIESTKYLALVAVLALLVVFVAALGWSVAKTYKVVSLIVSSAGQAETISLYLVQLLDAFLIAIVLYLFAVSLYELFIGELDLPEWMLAHNLNELKGKLSSVVVLVMAVRFLEHLLEGQEGTYLLLSGLATALVAGVLIAFGALGKKD